ncbi:MAG: hypothetical protein ACREFK_01875 [Stellaceae bacterium]
MRIADPLRRLCRTGALVLLVALLAATLTPRTGLAETAGPPPGTARIWIYRTYNPYVTQATPYVLVNGRIVGISELGSAFSLDVPPGTYRITVESEGRDVNQFATVAVVTGQTVYVKVSASNWWAAACRNCEIDTFYTAVVSPRLAWLEMSALPYNRG